MDSLRSDPLLRRIGLPAAQLVWFEMMRREIGLGQLGPSPISSQDRQLLPPYFSSSGRSEHVRFRR
jgi:hypothetical protein